MNQNKQSIQTSNQPRKEYFDNAQARFDYENFKPNVANVVDVNVIASYENYPQEMFDCMVSIAPLNTSIDNQISVEQIILEQVITHLGYDKEYLWKLSLCLMLPDFASDKELLRSGYGFIRRTNGKYYFHTDDRDAVSEYIADRFDVGVCLVN